MRAVAARVTLPNASELPAPGVVLQGEQKGLGEQGSAGEVQGDFPEVRGDLGKRSSGNTGKSR